MDGTEIDERMHNHVSRPAEAKGIVVPLCYANGSGAVIMNGPLFI